MRVGDLVRVRRSGSMAEVVALDVNALVIRVDASGAVLRVAPGAVEETQPWWYEQTTVNNEGES